MIDFQQIAVRYIEVWNETDPAARRRGVEALFTDDAGYVDPLADVRGYDALADLIGAVQAQFPGLRFSLAGDVDGHHGQVRFTWNLGPVGGEAPVVGFDVVDLGADGRITSVRGFLDKVPVAG